MINWRSEKHLFSKTPLRLLPNCCCHRKKGCIPEYFPKVLNCKLRLTENIKRI